MPPSRTGPVQRRADAPSIPSRSFGSRSKQARTELDSQVGKQGRRRTTEKRKTGWFGFKRKEFQFFQL